ncbi:MAG TPA: hypothetical protein VMW51_01425, partial [Terriglobia bacterium]|nr:hypothetical protein [Terriglobia bacterium]
ASQFKIPVGVELAASPSVLRPVRLSWQKATAMEILTAMVRGEKKCGLRVDDGIVHVFQKDLVNQQSNFLNIQVERFEVQNMGATGAWQKLWQLVNARFQPPKPPTPGPHGTAGSGTGTIGDRIFSLELRDTTVRSIMDRIALSSEYNIWVVTFAPGKALTPTGFRRTASPTTGRAGELAWEMLRWGEKPY